MSGTRETHPNLDDIEDCVYLKNSDRVHTLANHAFRQYFAAGVTPVGMASDSFLKSTVAKISAQTDRLILDGICSIEFEHVGVDSRNEQFLFRTYKQSLQERGYEPFAILGITRPIARIQTGGQRTVEDVQLLFGIYQKLTDQEKFICREIASGCTSKEIAVELDLSSRAIEIKRKKIMNRLGFARPIEIVKMMVRFQERGLVD